MCIKDEEVRKNGDEHTYDVLPICYSVGEYVTEAKDWVHTRQSLVLALPSGEDDEEPQTASKCEGDQIRLRIR